MKACSSSQLKSVLNGDGLHLELAGTPEGPTPVFTVNTYDALGRTLTTVAPDGSSMTSYVYQGNTVKVTDPAGKWKLYMMDAFGQLVQVVEPSPDANPNHVTTYLYDVLGH